MITKLANSQHPDAPLTAAERNAINTARVLAYRPGQCNFTLNRTLSKPVARATGAMRTS